MYYGILQCYFELRTQDILSASVLKPYPALALKVTDKGLGTVVFLCGGQPNHLVKNVGLILWKKLKVHE